jgi:hypothetical protein
MAKRLTAAGIEALSEYQRTGRPELLETAVSEFRDEVTATPVDHPYRAAYLSNLGTALLTRFERFGDIADLDGAVQARRDAVAATPTGHPGRAMYLSSLASYLLRRFERSGDLADLNDAIRAGRDEVAATPIGYPDRGAPLSNLGAYLRRRFERVGDVADVEAAIEVGKEAVAATPASDPKRAVYLLNLGLALFRRFERVGDVADVEAAIEVGREAVAATPADRPDRATMLSNLGLSLRARFERDENIADLNEAIQVGREAVAATPTGHPNSAGYLSNLGASLDTRFERFGEVVDLHDVIQVRRKLVAVTPADHPERAAYLSGLGASLRARFERVGRVADLDEAIDVEWEAVGAAALDHRDHAGYLSGLSVSLARRFEWSGDVADLDEAIDVGRKTVAAAKFDDPDRAGYLSNLGNSLCARFERVGDVADLEAAINCSREAVAVAPVDDPNRAALLSSLGLSLCVRFEQVKGIGDLDEAIEVGREAVAVIPAGHPDRLRCLSSLGTSLATRFEQLEKVADLEAAIQAGQDAVSATPPDHSELARLLSNLGLMLRTRFKLTHDLADLDAAIGYWRQASSIETAGPSTRLGAATAWGVAAASDGRRRVAAAEGFALAVGLLPVVAWHGLDRATRQDRLAQWSGLVSDAAACAVLAGRPELAVELLEQGRSVLWSQSLDLRTDLTRLRAEVPDLAGRLKTISAVLGTPAPDTPAAAFEVGGETVQGRDRRRQNGFDLRRDLAREWDQILTQVRKLKGFEHFLAPTPYVELAAVAVDGPVLVVNSSRYGCHALIVGAGSEQARVVDLPNLAQDSAIERATQMLQALSVAGDLKRPFLEREKDRRAVLDVLDWLWDVIGEPVLTALGRTAPPPDGEPWPRVWWCPTGVLSMLPIHAAGHHPRLRTDTVSISAAAAGEALSVLDRVVSSYTPTITALARAREPGTPALVAQLTVAMPITPGLSPLPAADAERNVLAQCFPPDDVNVELVGPDATHAVVLDAIATHSWVHLACHARQDQGDPVHSGFALWDGPLTIAHLAAKPTQRRDLAFLSACQTATGSVRHLDEAIHLAAAMQFLGYRHVIATMWTIADSPAPGVAKDVYTALTSDKSPRADHTARALHDAIRALRGNDPTNPIVWAPYTHLGA